MEITITENYEFQLEKVFATILLKTQDKEEMRICMRDSGFEFTYQGKYYSAQEGRIIEIINSAFDESVTASKDPG